MHFLPILSTLRRHKTAAALIVLEIALTCGIVCNTIFLIGERLDRMDSPTGVVEDELVRIMVTGIGKEADEAGLGRQDLAALRAIPGVKHVASVNMVPLGRSSWNSDISTSPDENARGVNSATYMGSADLLETLGVRLVAGRDFLPEEIVDYDQMRKQKAHPGSAIVTRALAARLYPGQNPLGKPIFVFGDKPLTIIGVIDHIVRPNDASWAGPGAKGWSALFPIEIAYTGQYLLRVDPARKAEALKAATAALDKVNPNRILLEQQTFDEVRREFYKEDRAMAWLLVGVCLALLLITALGIVGLASFWVQQRTRQIGIRRALGASRGDILRYFQTENFILATLGILLGMGFAYGINLLLMSKYQVPRLPGTFLPVGAVLVWFLGQVAVLGPALRAATIPPAIATRTV